MKAFTNTPVSKEQLLASLHAHRAADRLAKGHYWDDGKGCAVGCSLHDFAPGSEDLHAEYERLFGIPAALARLEDVIFENLPARAAQKWPVRFAEAIPEGADLSRVVPAFLVKLIERVADHPGCGGVHINEVLAVLREWRDTGTPDTARAAAAGTAADAARAAAAGTAADAAGRAVWAAARAAAWAARARARARAEAWAAVWAAEAAVKAGAATWRWIADTLIDCLKDAEAVETEETNR